MAASAWVAVEVGDGCWMLRHTRLGVLLRDLGWFRTREAAEARARALARVVTPARGALVGAWDRASLN